MSGSEDRSPAHLKRQRLIESLNAREAELAASQGGHPTHSKEGPEDQIEKERQRNYVRMGFGVIQIPFLLAESFGGGSYRLFARRQIEGAEDTVVL